MLKPSNDTPACSPPQKKWAIPLFIALIMLLGLFLRMNDMDQESIWWDEYTSVVHLTPPEQFEASPRYNHWNTLLLRQNSEDLLDFWKKNRSLDPATMPLYYTLEYGWNKYVSRYPNSIRFLSLSIGMLILPLIYLLGRKLYGHTAGLIAATCAAMSPIHGQFAIEIRMYCLFTLLALLSIYTFIHLFESRSRRWWLAHAVVNLLLFWTHPFATFIPLLEGLFLLYASFRNKRRIIIWGGLQILLFIPSAIYMSTIKFWAQDTTASWMKVPTLNEFLGDLFADDCIGLTYQLRATTKTWEILFNPKIAASIVEQQLLFGKLLLAFFLCALSLFVAHQAWKEFRKKRDTSTTPSIKWSSFLFLWWLLPPVLLYIISISWRPCLMPRYTLHCSLALYILLGAAITAIPWRILRRICIVLLFSLYAYEQSLILAGPQHTNWKAAADHIKANATPTDPILVKNGLWKRVFYYNLGPTANALSHARTANVLAEQSAFYLTLPPEIEQTEDAPRQLWLIIRTDYFAGGPDYNLERELTLRNLSFARYEFTGIMHVLLYRVQKGNKPIRFSTTGMNWEAADSFSKMAMEFWRNQNYPYCIKIAQKALEIDSGYAPAYNAMGMSYKELKQYAKAIPAFEKTIELNAEAHPWAAINLAELLTRRNRAYKALPVIQEALVRLPNDSWGHTVLGWVLMELKRYDEARTAFEKAIAFAPYDNRPQEGLKEVENRKKGLAPTPWS